MGARSGISRRAVAPILSLLVLGLLAISVRPSAGGGPSPTDTADIAESSCASISVGSSSYYGYETAMLRLREQAVAEGASIYVSGNGFGPCEWVSLLVSEQQSPKHAVSRRTQPVASGRAQADVYGRLAEVALTLPNGLAPGVYVVDGLGEWSLRLGSTIFSLRSDTLWGEVSSGRRAPGDRLGVRGGGFGPGEVIVIYLTAPRDADTPPLPLTALLADASGNIPFVEVTVPLMLDAGEYTVLLRGKQSAKEVRLALQWPLP